MTRLFWGLFYGGTATDLLTFEWWRCRSPVLASSPAKFPRAKPCE